MAVGLRDRLERKLALGFLSSIQPQDILPQVLLTLVLSTIVSLPLTSLLALPSPLVSTSYLPLLAQLGSSVCRECDALSYNFPLFP